MEDQRLMVTPPAKIPKMGNERIVKQEQMDVSAAGTSDYGLNLKGTPGSCRLYETERRTLKFGNVNVTKDDILRGLDYCMALNFFPVTLKQKDYITTHLHCQNRIQFEAFLKKGHNREVVAESLFSSIKNQIIQQLDIGMEESVQGQSTEMHKEVTDKYYVRKLLVSLSGDEAFQSISFGEEVHFDPLASTGPNGNIDLLIGSQESNVAEADLQIKFLNDVIIGISNTAMSETKSSQTHLSRVNSRAATDGLLATISQPVLVLLSVAQAFKTSGPHMLFYGNRYRIRPFVYYRSADILLTTDSDIQWMNVDENALDITGVCLVALLLRTNRAVQFESFAGFLQEIMKFPKTGFIDAMDGTVDLTRAVLKCTSFVSAQHTPVRASDVSVSSIDERKKILEDKETYYNIMSKKCRLN